MRAKLSEEELKKRHRLRSKVYWKNHPEKHKATVKAAIAKRLERDPEIIPILRERSRLKAAAYRVRQLKYSPEKYKANYTKNNTMFKKQRRELSNKLKDKPCTDCGIKYPPYVMDWDHVRGTKLANVSGNTLAAPLAVLLAEIDKCELVCSNCHRERTYQKRWKR